MDPPTTSSLPTRRSRTSWNDTSVKAISAACAAHPVGNVPLSAVRKSLAHHGIQDKRYSDSQIRDRIKNLRRKGLCKFPNCNYHKTFTLTFPFFCSEESPHMTIVQYFTVRSSKHHAGGRAGVVDMFRATHVLQICVSVMVCFPSAVVCVVVWCFQK